ncbi:MAG: TSUP family transporter [Eubacteriales bacterium]
MEKAKSKKTEHTGIPVSEKRRLLLAAAALVAGFCNGLLGSGAGILFIFSLRRFCPGMAEQRIFSLSLSSVFAITCCTVLFYGMRGNADPAAFAPMAVPAALGGAAGALLLSRLNTRVLRLIFSLLLLISGILMLVR